MGFDRLDDSWLSSGSDELGTASVFSVSSSFFLFIPFSTSEANNRRNRPVESLGSLWVSGLDIANWACLQLTQSMSLSSSLHCLDCVYLTAQYNTD